jgi:hypothetical protein
VRVAPPHIQSDGTTLARVGRPGPHPHWSVNEISAPNSPITVTNHFARKQIKTIKPPPPPPRPRLLRPIAVVPVSSALLSVRCSPPLKGGTPGHCRTKLPFLECPRPGHHDALPRAHMASGVLHRSASRCLRPAAAPTPDSGRGHGAVMVSFYPRSLSPSLGVSDSLGLPLCLSLGFLGCRRSVIRGRAVLLCGWEDLAGESSRSPL